MGMTWPDSLGGKGHNETALQLPDKRYAAVVSETRPDGVFVSNSLDGPWEHPGSIKDDANGFNPRDSHMSNVSVMLRPDGKFEIVPQLGAIMISSDGILGPYKIQGPSVYQGIMPEGTAMGNLEDPVVWYSGDVSHRGQLLERAEGLSSDLAGWDQSLEEPWARLRSGYELRSMQGRDRKSWGEDGAPERVPGERTRCILHIRIHLHSERK